MLSSSTSTFSIFSPLIIKSKSKLIRKKTYQKTHLKSKFQIKSKNASKIIQNKLIEENNTKKEPNTNSKDTILPFKFIFAFSTIGFIETLYLSYIKLTNNNLICSSDGCNSVLNSIYSEIHHIPLSIFGMIGYGSLAMIAGKLIFSKNNNLNAFKKILLYGGTLMASSSAYLMYILFNELKSECPWCFTSAALSFLILICAILNQSKNSIKCEIIPCTGLSVTSILTLTLLFNNAQISNAIEINIPYEKPEIMSKSTKSTIDLANRLNKAGVKMFGAFWCSHCYNQKLEFGSEAMKNFPYIECFPDGYGKGKEMAKICIDNDIKGMPTWAFGDQKYPGEQSLEFLEEALIKYENKN